MELKNKKILVTGADGFIGSHLVEKLVEKGAKVKAFVYYNSFNSWGWLDSFDKSIIDKIEIFAGDVRDASCVKMAAKNCDIIFHLAALIAIPFSYYSPESYVDTNIKGTLNILQAARELNIEKTLVTSTSEVYGTAQYIPIDENHPYQGQSPYSATKIGADRIAESFYKSFSQPIVIVRPFNTFGPRQSARAIIPTIITQILNGEKIVKLGNLNSFRDFLFVKDTVNGFISIAESDQTNGEEINIATGQKISMLDIAQKIINYIGCEAKIVLDDQRLRPEMSEVDVLQGCNKKIQSITDWKQMYDLDQGLQETIDWFKNPDNLKNYKTNIYNI